MGELLGIDFFLLRLLVLLFNFLDSMHSLNILVVVVATTNSKIYENHVNQLCGNNRHIDSHMCSPIWAEFERGEKSHNVFIMPDSKKNILICENCNTVDYKVFFLIRFRFTVFVILCCSQAEGTRSVSFTWNLLAARERLRSYWNQSMNFSLLPLWLLCNWAVLLYNG